MSTLYRSQQCVTIIKLYVRTHVPFLVIFVHSLLLLSWAKSLSIIIINLKDEAIAEITKLLIWQVNIRQFYFTWREASWFDTSNVYAIITSNNSYVQITQCRAELFNNQKTGFTSNYYPYLRLIIFLFKRYLTLISYY